MYYLLVATDYSIPGNFERVICYSRDQDEVLSLHSKLTNRRTPQTSFEVRKQDHPPAPYTLYGEKFLGTQNKGQTVVH